MKQKFSEIAHVFRLPCEIADYKVITNGNINESYDVVITVDEKESRFVFQKINIFVFKNPKRIMKNIEKITSHIADKLEMQGKSRDRVLHFAHTSDGKNYYIEEQGFWRVSEFVPNTVTHNSCDDLALLRSAGEAFGNFQTMPGQGRSPPPPFRQRGEG